MNLKTTDDPALLRTYRVVALLGGALALAGFSFWGVKEGFSLLVGSAVALINLWGIEWTVKSFLVRKQARWLGGGLFKMLFLLGALFFLLKTGSLQLLALAAGFSVLPFGIFIAGLFGVSSGPASSENPSDVPLAKETDHA